MVIEGMEYADKAEPKKTFRQAAVEVAKKIGRTAKEHPVAAVTTLAAIGAATINPLVLSPFAFGGITHFTSLCAGWKNPVLNGAIAGLIMAVGHIVLVADAMPKKNDTSIEAFQNVKKELLAIQQSPKDGLSPFIVKGRGYNFYVSDIEENCKHMDGKRVCEIKADVSGKYSVDTIDVFDINLWRNNRPKTPYRTVTKQVSQTVSVAANP